jgi:hypothetical protein
MGNGRDKEMNPIKDERTIEQLEQALKDYRQKAENKGGLDYPLYLEIIMNLKERLEVLYEKENKGN